MRVSVFMTAWLLLGAAAPVEAAWTITQLTDNSLFEWWPDVSGSNVVWGESGTQGGSDIFPVRWQHHAQVDLYGPRTG